MNSKQKTLTLIVAIIFIISLGFLAWNSNNTPTPTPEPTSVDDIVVTTEGSYVDISSIGSEVGGHLTEVWSDYTCPYCTDFSRANPEIYTPADGDVTRIHVMTKLDHPYTYFAGAVSLYVAQNSPDVWVQVHRELLLNNPPNYSGELNTVEDVQGLVESVVEEYGIDLTGFWDSNEFESIIDRAITSTQTFMEPPYNIQGVPTVRVHPSLESSPDTPIVVFEDEGMKLPG